MAAWCADDAGVLCFPGGKRVRGRALSARHVPEPEFGLYLVGGRSQGRSEQWPVINVWWPDFLVPLNPTAFVDELQALWRRASTERVEVVCKGGRGRTGTAHGVA